MTIQKQKLIIADDLRKAKDVLDSLGVKFWLTLGTCLGAYRDNDFCPGDIDDVDLGVEYEAYPRKDEIIQAFKDAGWKLIMEWRVSDDISTELTFIKEYDSFKTKVDLWFYTPNPKNESELIFRMYKNLEEWNDFLLPARFHSSFKEIIFYGQKYLIPEDIEGYLKHNYGDNWRTPIHRDNWNYYTANHSPKL
jgi:phosphorylcholine metabolism protein LicD